MKKLIAVLTALILVLAMLLPCCAAGAASGGGGGAGVGGITPAPNFNGVYIEISDVVVERGMQTVSVDVYMTKNDGCTSISLEIDCDREVLTLNNITDSGVFSGATHAPQFSATSSYRLTWANDLSRTDITATGKIATLNFNVNAEAAAGIYPISIVRSQILDCDVNDVELRFSNGSVSITDDNRISVYNYVKTNTTASFDLGLYCGDGVCGTVAVASYDENGTMISLKPYAAQGQITDISVDIENVDKVNIMWWNMSNINPFAECKIIKID